LEIKLLFGQLWFLSLLAVAAGFRFFAKIATIKKLYVQNVDAF
jgi:hypothetical protein